MNNWIERLKEEKSELEVNIKSLDEFMISSAYQELDLTEKYLTGEQSDLMENYLSIIRDRMQRAGAKNCQIDLNSMFLDGIDKSLIEHYYKTEAPKDEYVTSSTANADNVNKAKSILEDARDEYVEGKGFKGYMGAAGYIDTTHDKMNEWTSIKGKGLFAQMNDESLKYAKMSEELQKAVKEVFPIDLDESLDDITHESLDDITHESLDDITQTEITPKALIVLGFEENYQGVDMGNPGYIYYTLYILDVEFISTSLEDDGPFHVMFGNNCQFSICNLRKLEDLILSLKEVS